MESRVTRLEVLVHQFIESVRQADGDTEQRLRKLERTVWTASGGVIVAQAIFTTIMLVLINRFV